MPQEVECALCGSNESELDFIGRDRLHDVPGEFNVVLCKNCRMVYLNPRPTWAEMEQFYTSDYAPYSEGSISFLSRLIQSGGLQRKRRIVEQQSAGGTILDVGCATGDFLRYMAQDKRWKVYGIEPNAQAAQRAAQISGAQVFNGRLEEAQFSAHFFDVITMWHVMEHLYDPKGALRVLRRLLKPDGRLVLAVPILDSVDARLFGPYWSGYDVPRHLYAYSVSTLSEMLSLAGFSSVRTESFIGGFSAFRISLHFWSEERLESRFLRKMIRFAFKSPLLQLLMLPYFAIVNRLGRGSTLVVTACPGRMPRH